MDVGREDLTLFLNACAVATGQNEFYSSDSQQQVSLQFLHYYICANYRKLYSYCLFAGVNDFNRAEIIFQLLRQGRACEAANRAQENAFITAALAELPAQRAWKLIARLKMQRVNNRRTRSLIRSFINNRKDLAFDAVKYGKKVRSAIIHSHLKISGEIPTFLFEGLAGKFSTPILDKYRAAHFSKEAIYELPYSIAEGLAARHGIPRDVFLPRIQKKMTDRERLRLQDASSGKVKIEPHRISLTELCVYVLSLSLEERRERREQLSGWLLSSVQSTVRKMGHLQLSGRVAAVLDNSYSASGTRERLNRPLAVAMSVDFLLRHNCEEYQAFWMHDCFDSLLLHSRGQTHITEKILDALEWGADTIVVVSDACENDVPDASQKVLEAYRKIGGKAVFVHLNPVFDPETYQVRPIASMVPALGLRAGEALATTLAFARFSGGQMTLSELEKYLRTQAERILLGQKDEPTTTGGDVESQLAVVKST